VAVLIERLSSTVGYKMNFQSGVINVFNPNPFEPLQTQMLLISIYCGKN
jgi:hypothetical protein